MTGYSIGMKYKQKNKLIRRTELLCFQYVCVHVIQKST